MKISTKGALCLTDIGGCAEHGGRKNVPIH